MSDSRGKKIIISKDGPYLVSGDVPLTVQIISTNGEGQSWEWKKGRSFEVKSDYRLCRCGHSKDMPFCDDSHLRVSLDGEETATRAPFQDQAKRYDGPTLTLSDAENFCAFARFCDPGGKIWGLMEGTDKADVRELVIREAMYCPSGRLVLRDKKTGKEVEPELPPSIGVVEDPALKCSGPLWVQGGIIIESHNGTRYEKRNRVTLCRCGASSNKPFCDGSHASIKFHDRLLKK